MPCNASLRLLLLAFLGLSLFLFPSSFRSLPFLSMSSSFPSVSALPAVSFTLSPYLSFLQLSYSFTFYLASFSLYLFFYISSIIYILSFVLISIFSVFSFHSIPFAFSSSTFFLYFQVNFSNEIQNIMIIKGTGLNHSRFSYFLIHAF